MAEQDIRDIARRYVEEVVNQGNMGLLDDLVSPDVVFHIPVAQHGLLRGIEALRSFREEVRAAFPDFHFTVASMITQGEEVSWHGTAAGSQRKEFAGISPMGKHTSFMVGEFLRIIDGKIVEGWVFYDTQSARQQLGAT